MQYALHTGQAELAGYAQASRMGAMTASIAHEGQSAISGYRGQRQCRITLDGAHTS